MKVWTQSKKKRKVTTYMQTVAKFNLWYQETSWPNLRIHRMIILLEKNQTKITLEKLQECRLPNKKTLWFMETTAASRHMVMKICMQKRLENHQKQIKQPEEHLMKAKDILESFQQIT